MKSFKGTANANKKGGHSQPTGPLPPKKRRLAEDLSGSIVDAAQVTPAQDDQLLVEVPIVNARAGKKLTTMPLLRITKNMGPYILNEAGQDVPWLSRNIYQFMVVPSVVVGASLHDQFQLQVKMLS